MKKEVNDAINCVMYLESALQVGDTKLVKCGGYIYKVTKEFYEAI